MTSRRPSLSGGALVAAAVAGCAVCCAGPLLAGLAAVGLTAGILSFAVPGLAVLALVAGAALWWLRRRSARHCAPAVGPIDLALPTLRSTDVLALESDTRS